MSTDVLPNPEDAASAPVGVPEKDSANFARPVAWLFGRQFIATLKWMLLYTAFKGKLDARDWMHANVLPEADATTEQEVDEYWRLWCEERGMPAAGTEFWFDYISDTGDGQQAVYSIAYLCMSDLSAPGDEPRVGDKLAPAEQSAADGGGGGNVLPRGAFLFVGGDTSYHISDYVTLAKRFQNPFCWAYRDLYRAKRASAMGDLPRMLLGIPGNHDYYDSLDGFNRQFRRPATGDERPDDKARRTPQLRVPTFERAQEASYLALRLPFGWWFWGLDTEAGEIDFRQWEFFNDLRKEHNPQRLIVATPEPTTVFGKYDDPLSSQSKTFAALGLERPFLKGGEQLAPNTCRLDLSGDIHHYARYWGPERGESSETSNYASVVAGGGGAFFHPTQTTAGELKPEVTYPAPDKSRERTADELFDFRNVVRGGAVWLFGFIIAFVVAFAANFPQSSRDSIDSCPPLAALGVSPSKDALAAEVKAQPTPLAYVKPMPRFTWGPDAQPTPPGFYKAAIALAVALALLGMALFYSFKRLFKRVYDPTWPGATGEGEKDKEKKARLSKQVRWLWVLVGASALALGLGIWGFRALEAVRPHEAVLTRFGRSLIILSAVAWVLMAVVQCVKYTEWLSEQARGENIETRRYAPVWLLVLACVLGLGSALWFFGRHEAAYMVSDHLLLVVVAAVVVGLTVYAVVTGASLRRWDGKLGFLFLGLSHGLLQLAVPFFLFRRGHLLWATLAAAGLVVLFMFLGRAAARSEKGADWLAGLWVLFGALLLLAPHLLPDTLWPHVFDADPLNRPGGGWEKLLLCLYAGVVGAATSCVLFAWYLAVSLAFNGHNNEAGGAARIEGFKQLIRFRLNREGLTGYVIGFDRPQTEGGRLEPKIVDIFRISERAAGGGSSQQPPAGFDRSTSVV